MNTYTGKKLAWSDGDEGNGFILTCLEEFLEQFVYKKALQGDTIAGDTPLTIASILCDAIKANSDLLLPVVQEFYGAITHLIQVNHTSDLSTTTSRPSSPSPKDIANAAISNMFGTVSFLFPTNSALLDLSIPHMLALGKLSPQIQSIVFSTLSSEAINQAKVLAPFINELINDFESNIPLLFECYEKTPESKASILAIFSEISKQNPFIIAPFIIQLKPCLQQQSLTTLYAILLKSIASKYQSAITPIQNDIFESISNNGPSEFISTLAQDIVERIKEHVATKILASPLPALPENLDDLDQRVEQANYEIAASASAANIHQLLQSRYQLVFDILQLVPVPCKRIGNDGPLQFAYGGETVALAVEGNILASWRRINLLQSAVNLNVFLVDDDITDIVSKPLIGVAAIQEIHACLSNAIDAARAAAPISSPAPSAIHINDVAPASPQVIGVSEQSTHSSVTDAKKRQSALGAAIVHEGYLDKQSRYLKRYDTLWFTLYEDSLIDEELMVKITRGEILAIKEAEPANKGHFTIKRKADLSQLENKSFYIVTMKRNPGKQKKFNFKLSQYFTKVPKK
eukprot:gene14810-17509_t